MEPLVWNQKTGNLVSGHQRLSILDELEGSENYTVAVAVVDLSEKREKELNVFLNNTGAQGHYDRDEFLALLDDGLSLDDIGFTKVDLEFEFGEIPDGLFASERAAVETTLDELNLIKDRKKKYRELSASDPSDDSDYYVMVCFNSATEKNEWLKANQFPLDIRMVAATEIEVSRKT